VLISGGFDFFTSRVAQAAGFHAHWGNKLIDDGEALTGRVAEPILGRDAKLSTLRAEAAGFGAAMADTLARLPEIRPRHDFTALEIDALEDRLYEHNRAATGHADGRGLGFEIIGEDGAQLGAIAGHTWGGVAEIAQMWVDPAHRGGGLGLKLLDGCSTRRWPKRRRVAAGRCS
jgi:GNAT superfamily N-acetyltransferase